MKITKHGQSCFLGKIAYNQDNMSPQAEKEILRRLERIECLLVKFVPEKTGLTEKEVLNFVNEGRASDKSGKSRRFEEFLKERHPKLVGK